MIRDTDDLAQTMAVQISVACNIANKMERDRTLGRLFDETERAERNGAPGFGQKVCRLVRATN